VHFEYSQFLVDLVWKTKTPVSQGVSHQPIICVYKQKGSMD